MIRLSLFPVLFREIFGASALARVPEPDLIMEDADQVKAYSESGRAEGLMAAGYLFHTAQALSTIARCKRVLDLGCGPATQLAMIAAQRPDIQFVGVDLSAEMLRWGRSHIEEQGLRNVELVEGDITTLSRFRDQEFDGVISTLTLHHLPTLDMLKACFQQVSRILKPDGALYIADFGRLKSEKSITYFAYMNADKQPRAFTLDYEHSLRAAFSLEEFRAVSSDVLPGRLKSYATFIVPLLVVIQTPTTPLEPDLLRVLQDRRKALPDRYRADLDELRRFCRKGGLPYDPFGESVALTVPVRKAA